MHSRVSLFGLEVDADRPEEILNRLFSPATARGPVTAFYVNAHVFNLAQDDAAFRNTLQRSDILLADGFGARFAAKLTGQRVPQRMAITDYIWSFAERCSDTGAKVFILAGAPGVAERASAELRNRFPGLEIVGTHHGFVADEDDSCQALQQIRDAGPDVLLVGMGSPIQERWIEANKSALGVPITIAVGAVMDFVSGDVERRRPQWMSDAGLEWVTRLAAEPRRMWHRYLVGNPRFVGRTLRARAQARRATPRPLLADGRKALGERTGVGHYALSLFQHWPGDAQAVRVLVPRGTNGDVAWDGRETVEIPGGARFHLYALLHTLVSRGIYYSPESLIVPALLGRRAAITIHDLTPLTDPAVHTRRNVFFSRIFIPIVVRRVGLIVTPTAAVANELLARFPERNRLGVVVAHEGHRSDKADVESLEGAAGNRFALYVGTIEPRKNVSVLIDAFLAGAPSDWRLVVAGRIGWLSPSELARFEELVSNDRVDYRGYVTDAELEGLYRDATLFCYVPRAEGFGLPVLEAMAHGVPVVHSDDPALCEVSGGAAAVVSQAQMQSELTSEIRRLAADDNELTRLSAAGLERAKHFDWGVMAKTIASELERLAARA